MLNRKIEGMINQSTMGRGLLLVVLCAGLCDGLSLAWFGATRDTHVSHAPRRTHSNYLLLTRVRRSVWGEGQETTTTPASITSLQILCQISSRFSETVVTSVISNPTQENKEAHFTLDIPEKAFISNFTMVIDGQLIVTEVKSKEEAEKMYEEAREQNKTAGKVSSSDPPSPQEAVPGMERFTIAIAVKADSSVEFELAYLQLLERVNGMYEQVISMRPQQIVPDFRVDVYVYDKQGVTDLSIFEPSLGSNSLEYQIAKVEKLSNYQQHVSFYPTAEQQREMHKTLGVNRELFVSYDVVHGDNGGLVEVEDGHFAHYFSPDEYVYSALPKHIVFVIDISGSMSGDKMRQTRDAFQTIIDQLQDQDTFMLLLFDDKTEIWPSENEPVRATSDNKNAAKDYARKKLFADGSTNIEAGLVTACNILRRQNNPRGSNLVMFLTDGEPTAGETNPDRLVSLVTDAAANQVVIYSLAFGYSLNFELLEKLAYRTNGGVQRIYTDEYASNQLTKFYGTISTPIIYDIDISYPEDRVEIGSVTQTSYNQFFQGSELVMVGKLIGSVLDTNSFEATVTGKAKKGSEEISEISLVTTSITEDDLGISTDVSPPTGFVEKLYVYMRIKYLLKEKLMTDNTSKQKALEEEALALALKYRLVTPLTSMIIVQPDGQLENQSEDDMYRYDIGMMASAVVAPGPSCVLYLAACVVLILSHQAFQ